MVAFVCFCVWIASLLLATFLGFDRGRWGTGLLLGLLFGPLGMLAAGLMRPSVECEGARHFALHRQLRRLQQLEQREAHRRRGERAGLDAVAAALEHGLEAEQVGFADRLQQLAGELDEMAGGAPPGEPHLRTWSGWLKEKAEQVRTLPRYNQTEL